MCKLTGMVGKAYAPRRGQSDFFFQVVDLDGRAHKGMARAEFMRDISLGNAVEIEGKCSRGWWKPASVKLLSLAYRQVEEKRLRIEHVGYPRQGHYGWQCHTKLENGDWLVIPCAVMLRHFEGNGVADKAYQLPGRGRGELWCKVARIKGQGQVDLVVEEIVTWVRHRKEIDVRIPFKKVYWGSDYISFYVQSQRVKVPLDDLPFTVAGWDVVRLLPSLDAELCVQGQMVAVSDNPNHVTWQVEHVQVTTDAEIMEHIEAKVNANKLARAVKAVRTELDELWSNSVIVDLSMVHQLFLKHGVKATDEQAYQYWARRDYDNRFLDALKELAVDLTGQAEIYAASEGFFLRLGDWWVWERPWPGAATYILPAQPNEALTDEPLTDREWAAVLGRILPEANKMDLRYGEIGQALAGCVEGVQFAFHVLDDDGNLDGWLDSVKGAVWNSPTPVGEWGTLPDLDEVLALTSGEDSHVV